MTSFNMTGASSTSPPTWDTVPWPKVERQVRRLQMRIAKAFREGHRHKVQALQRLLTHSGSAKLLAVRRVTTNTGRHTPGIDGVRWTTPKQKWQAVATLRRHGYRAVPLRRIYIPKKNGKQRPLGIPSMKDRAMQALYLLALEPIAETTADPNSYGFRVHRSAADAIEQCFILLARKSSSQWILEGDIKACFDGIDHAWLNANIPMDKTILAAWLKSGYCEQGRWFATEEGTPQGGIASPTLANMTLDGLETVVAQAIPKGHKAHVVRYADDFIVTGDAREVLEHCVKPAIERFLLIRGLELSPEKTRMSHINGGFDFLGFNVRKYQGKLLITPARKNVSTFLANVREIIKIHPTAKTANLIQLLNPKIRGWANYYRHVVASHVFNTVDHHLYMAIDRWVKRRHPNKNRHWQQLRYFCQVGGDRWRFFAPIRHHGEPARVLLIKASSVKIQRHIKIRAMATPFDPGYREYFATRLSKPPRRAFSAGAGSLPDF